jgi:hypothetical protein
MELNLDINIDDSKTLTNKFTNVFKIAVIKCGAEWMRATKQILQNKDAVDTGEFINSIHYDVTKRKDTYIMTGMDAVKYGVYIEKGTVEHWVPFYKYMGNHNGRAIYDTSQPILADWGRRVLGLTENKMLKMGGMKVSNTGTNAFEQGLIHLQHTTRKIFEDTFRENME